MFKLLIIAALIAPIPAAADSLSSSLSSSLLRAGREKEMQDHEFAMEKAARDAAASREADDRENAFRASNQQRALDDINMQLYQMNTR